MKRKLSIFFYLSLFSVALFSNEKLTIRNPEDAIYYALQNNKSILLSRQNASCNLLKNKKNIGEFIPKLNISFSDSALININSSDYRNKNLNLGLSWIVFDGGERRLKYKLNILDAAFSRLQNEEAIENHCLEILESYYEIQKELKNKEIISETLESARNWKTALEMEFEMGMILETDYLEYETKAIELESKLSAQENKLMKLVFQMKRLLGLKQEDDVSILFEKEISESENSKLEDFNSLYSKIKDSSLDLKKLKMNIDYSKKLNKLENSYYLPKISFEPGVIFQGKDYPLRGPKYQMMFSISFDRNPFLSLQGSQTFSYEKNKLTGVTNYDQSSSKNNFSWKESKQLGKLDLRSQIFELTDYEEQLKENLKEMLMENEYLRSSINILEKEIEINERLLIVLKKEIENGNKCPLDYLDQHIVLSEKKASLYSTIIQLSLNEKKIKLYSTNFTGDFINEFIK